MPLISKKETIIISLGGSLVAPDGINTVFLKKFSRYLQKHLAKRKFFIFVGGGKTARIYQKAMLEFGADNSDRDWVGINISRLNAEVVRQVFIKNSYAKVVTDPSKRISTRKEIVVAGGWKPGWSTDYCSVIMAKNSGLKTIVNLTNVDYVYDKDPSKSSNARQIKEISWQNFRKIIGDKWSPGLSVPFDPRASKMAEILKIKVAIINGNNLERLDDFLDNKPFIGTIIQ